MLAASTFLCCPFSLPEIPNILLFTPLTFYLRAVVSCLFPFAQLHYSLFSTGEPLRYCTHVITFPTIHIILQYTCKISAIRHDHANIGHTTHMQLTFIRQISGHFQRGSSKTHCQCIAIVNQRENFFCNCALYLAKLLRIHYINITIFLFNRSKTWYKIIISTNISVVFV